MSDVVILSGGGTAACRAGVSYATGYFTPAGAVYNAVDQLVQIIAFVVFSKAIKENKCFILAPPVLGGVCGYGVTVLCFGTMGALAALAISVSSCAVLCLIATCIHDVYGQL